MYAQRGSGTLLIAERLALERLDRLWGYPDDIVTAAESLWREAAKQSATRKTSVGRFSPRLTGAGLLQSGSFQQYPKPL
jgi:hypothetical protein